ncbi:DNA-binding NtrC family response regulator, partial [Janthinobacterium sp. CG_23.3]|uniref:helix-turn-helix domain-containing protein n=1 Tax=Janthinobacterium sp. CG_23.3 TaxID=3349634 RepID=UPI0038D47F74
RGCPTDPPPPPTAPAAAAGLDGAPAAAAPGFAFAAAPDGGAGLPHCLPEYLSQVERDIIVRALAQTQFNRTQAAQLLGISFRQLRYQMQKLNIQEPEA